MDVLVRRLVVDASGDALLSLVVQHTIGGAPARRARQLRQELTVIVLVVTGQVRSGQVTVGWRHHIARDVTRAGGLLLSGSRHGQDGAHRFVAERPAGPSGRSGNESSELLSRWASEQADDVFGLPATFSRKAAGACGSFIEACPY